MEKQPLLISHAAEDSTLPLKTEERFLTIGGGRMRYLLAGSGPPIVLLHGLLAYSFSWRFNLPVLAQHATVYAVDMLGAGFSDRPAQLDCSLRSSARRLLDFLDVAGVSSCDLLATSHGGAVAMMLAALCPEQRKRQLQRLILVAPVNPWSPHGRHLAQFLSNPIGAFLFSHAAPYLSFTYGFWLRRLYADPARIPPGTLEGYAAPYKIPGSFDHGLSIMRHWNSDLRELESVVPKIADYPTLLIWGSHDSAVDPSSAEPLRRVFKQCELVLLDGVGHLPYEEAAPEFNRAVIQFLKTTPVVSSQVMGLR